MPDQVLQGARPLVVAARRAWLLSLSALPFAACGDAARPSDLTGPPGAVESVTGAAASTLDPEVVARVRAAAAERGLTSLGPPPVVRPALAELGRALMFDKILSGNADISCMTCHLPERGTGDGRQLSIGQGGTGVGPDRVHPEGLFIPRNAPALFNLHAQHTLFWDGRVERHADGSLTTPAGQLIGSEMAEVFEFGAISALGLFPVASREEMRTFGRGNELAKVEDDDLPKIWKRLMKRLERIPSYVAMFEAAYPGTKFQHMNFAHASNAMAGFLVRDFFFDDSPWDRFLGGDDEALTAEQLAGADIFTTIRCSICHTGPTLSDGLFHNVALAALGPGQGDGPLADDDFGRGRVTESTADLYSFRTTPLRNVELSAPYGHAGQFMHLRDFIDHYSDSEMKLRNYPTLQGANVEPALYPTIRTHNFDAIMATRSPIIDGVVFDDQVTGALTEFMLALTDDRARNLLHVRPGTVPSGLPVD